MPKLNTPPAGPHTELVNATLSALRRHGLHATWEPDPNPSRTDTHRQTTGHLHVTWEGGSHRFPTQVVPTARPSLITVAGPPETPSVFLTNHVTPAIAETLTRTGWAGYADTTGNAHLTAPGLHVTITGNRPTKTAPAPTALPFQRTGLPVTYGLLVGYARDTKWTQRELARFTNSSLGTVNRVLTGLHSTGRPFADAAGQLIRPVELRNAWTASFLTHQPVVWPNERFTSATWDDPTVILHSPLPEGCLLSSELAAHALSVPIRPSTALIYTTAQARTALIRQGRLRPDPDGPISLRPSFWAPELHAGQLTVPDFLIRADLLLEDDPRLDEIAHTL